MFGPLYRSKKYLISRNRSDQKWIIDVVDGVELTNAYLLSDIIEFKIVYTAL